MPLAICMKQYTYDGKTWYDLKEGMQVPLMALDSRDKPQLENSQSFVAGELLEWQEMSRLIRELQGEISDFKIRIDDLERAVGDWDTWYDTEIALPASE